MKSSIRRISLMLIICLLSGCIYVQADGVKEISSIEDLKNIKNDPSGSYVLTCDLDLGGEAWEPFAFSGSLDGNGHSITNVKISKTPSDVKTVTDANVYAKGTSYEAVCCGFFTVLEGAEIKNLGLWGIDIKCGGKDFRESIFAGLLAGYAYGSSVRNCQIAGSCEVVTSGPCFGAAGVFGFVGAGTIERCHVECELVCTDTDVEYKDEQFMGGAYGFGYSDITDCYFSIQGWDSDHGYVHDGGLVGCFMYYDSQEVNYKEVSITGNYIGGQITFYEDNWDTRAYCEPVAGEVMNWNLEMYGNSDDFTRNQIYDYDVVLYPHCTCEAPAVFKYDVAASAGKPGYHLEVCENCGYSRKSNFSAPLEGVFTDNKIQNWQPPLEGCADMLVISSHADDEQLFYAGILPYYAQVKKLAVQVVYGTDHIAEPNRHNERKNGLWGVGIINEPDSSGWYDEYAETKEEAIAHLNYRYGITEDDVIDWMRDIILKYKPQVVITHDINGEYGHGFHKLMASALRDCLEKYGSEFPFLKKAYLHLGDENPISLTVIDEKYGELDGLSAFQVTQKYGFSEHYSQHWTWFYDWIYYGFADGETPNYEPITKAASISSYSPMSWGLIYGDASLDVKKNDLFEGLISYREQARLEAEKKAEEERLERERLEVEAKAEEERLAQLAKRRKTVIIIFSVIAFLAVLLISVRTYNISKRRRRKTK